MEVRTVTDSQLIAIAFNALRRFCCDVALLLTTTEEIFQARGWQAAQLDKGCIYAGSYSLDRPRRWLPRRFFRTYSSPGFPNILAYVAVVIELPPGRESTDGKALLTAGGLEYSDAIKPLTGEGTELVLWHLHRLDRDDSGVPSVHNEPFQWTENPLPKGLKLAKSRIKSAVTLAMPLHEINDTNGLLGRVIEPLIAKLGACGQPDGNDEIDRIVASEGIQRDADSPAL